MSRPITKLVPDLREMLQDALEETAKQVHEDLWNNSPWWSGQFANSWEVLPGIRSIKPNIASADKKKGGKGWLSRRDNPTVSWAEGLLNQQQDEVQVVGHGPQGTA